MKEDIKRLATELLNKYEEITVNGNNQVSYGKTPKIKKSMRDFSEKVMKPMIMELKLIQLLMVEIDQVLESTLKEIIFMNKDKKKDMPVSQTEEIIKSLVFLVDPTDPNKQCVLDTRTNSLTNYSVDSLKMYSIDKKQFIFQRAVLEFNPYKPSQYTVNVGIDVTPAYNLYNPPKWRTNLTLTKEEISELNPPKIFSEFIERLVPNEKCRNFVLDWMHHALVAKNNTYLVLNGAKGIGKNILSNDIMSKLVGENYHVIAPESATDSNFNSFLLDKRVIVMDEKKVPDGPALNKLKRYINAGQAVEKKGVDSNKTIETFNSFIICNNKAEEMHIEYDDRRFSVIDLTKKSLKKKKDTPDGWDKDKIESLSNMSDEDVSQLGYWLFYRTPKFDTDTAWIGEHFYYLCYTSCTEWQKIIVDFCVEGKKETFGQRDLKKEYRNRNGSTKSPKKQKIIDFVDNYLHQAKYSLGELIEDDDDLENGWTIKVNSELIELNKAKKEILEGDLL